LKKIDPFIDSCVLNIIDLSNSKPISYYMINIDSWDSILFLVLYHLKKDKLKYSAEVVFFCKG
jgi:hypothetical protein